MANYTLAANPIRPWTSLSSLGAFALRSSDNNSFIIEGSAAGLSATIEVYGSNFGARGANLRDGTAQVNVVQYTVGGQVVMRTDNALVTGEALRAWLVGDGTAFDRAAFAGNDAMSLSNYSERQLAYGGDDLVYGFGGADTLVGGAGHDTLDGGDGDDWLEGELGDDVVVCDTGNDYAHGGTGADKIYSGSGSDTLLGADGNDTLYGDDTFYGSEGSNRLDGGSGDDLIIGGRNFDSVVGDAGTDTFFTGALKRQIEFRFFPASLDMRGPQGLDVLYSVERIAFMDGALHLDPTGTAGQVWRLYDAAFGRGAETIGLSNWVQALDARALSLTDAANRFLGSDEFGQRYGQPDDAAFVARLYANVLDRAPDVAGLQGWTARLADGASRAEVLVGFSESAEHRATVDSGITNRLWTVDPEALEVLRCYMTVLDRRPDAGGLATWTSQRDANQLTSGEMVNAFIRSPEAQARFGGLSNEGFVARLYQSALDRPADSAGLPDWTAKLDSGAIQRRDVVQGFAYSDEMTQRLLPLVADGIAFA